MFQIDIVLWSEASYLSQVYVPFDLRVKIHVSFLVPEGIIIYTLTLRSDISRTTLISEVKLHLQHWPQESKFIPCKNMHWDILTSKCIPFILC
jgi:hypothetical protein